MGQSQDNNIEKKIEERKKKETSAEKKAIISEDVALGDIASDKIFEADPELAKELEEDRKIQAKALEYKEKKQQRARKRRKRLIITLIVIAVLALAGFLGYKYYQQKKAAENSEAIVQVSDDQELVYASVTKIAGNNITVEILQESSGMTVEVVETSGESADAMEGASGMGEKQDGTPDMQTDASDMQGGGSSDMQRGGMNMEETDSESSYVETGETVEYQIPVGTVVITKLGTSATFSSISSGNVIAIALEKGTDIIDKVWIVQ